MGHPQRQRQDGPPESTGPPGRGRRPAWPLLLILVILALMMWPLRRAGEPSIPCSRFKQALTADNVDRPTVEGEKVTGRFTSPIEWPEGREDEDPPPETTIFRTTLPPRCRGGPAPT